MTLHCHALDYTVQLKVYLLVLLQAADTCTCFYGQTHSSFHLNLCLQVFSTKTFSAFLTKKLKMLFLLLAPAVK